MNVRVHRLPLAIYGVAAMLIGFGVFLFVALAKYPNVEPTLPSVVALFCLIAAVGLATRNRLGYTMAICVLLGGTVVALLILLRLLSEVIAATYLPVSMFWWSIGLATTVAIYAHWRDRGILGRAIRTVTPWVRFLLAALALIGTVELIAGAVQLVTDSEALNRFVMALHTIDVVQMNLLNMPDAFQRFVIAVPVAAALSWSASRLLRAPTREEFLTAGGPDDAAPIPPGSNPLLAVATSDSAARFGIILLPLVVASLVGSVPRDVWEACIHCARPFDWTYAFSISRQLLSYGAFAILLWLNRSSIRTLLVHGPTTDLLVLSAAWSNAAVLVNLEVADPVVYGISGGVVWPISAVAIEALLFVAIAGLVSHRKQPAWSLAPLLTGIPSMIFTVHALSVGWYDFNSSGAPSTCLGLFASLHAYRAVIVNFSVQIIVAAHTSLRTRANWRITCVAMLLASFIAWHMFYASNYHLFGATDLRCTMHTRGVSSWMNNLWP